MMIVSLLAFSLFVVGVCGGYWIYSDLLTLNVSDDYSLTLTASPNGLIITLSGILLDPNDIHLQDKTIILERFDDASGTNLLETLTPNPTTDVNGYYEYEWTAPVLDTYYFRAKYEVV